MFVSDTSLSLLRLGLIHRLFRDTFDSHFCTACIARRKIHTYSFSNYTLCLGLNAIISSLHLSFSAYFSPYSFILSFISSKNRPATLDTDYIDKLCLSIRLCSYGSASPLCVNSILQALNQIACIHASFIITLSGAPHKHTNYKHKHTHNRHVYLPSL